MQDIRRRDLLGLTAASTAAGCGGGGTATIQAAPPPPASQDDTAMLQARLDAGQELPEGEFNTSASLFVTHTNNVRGAGTTATVIRSSAAEPLVVQPTALRKKGFWLSISDLSIEPAVARQGKSALVFRTLPDAPIYQWTIERVFMGDFGGPGLLLDNTSGAGIFSGLVEKCWVANGVKGVEIGDSVRFVNNSITDGYDLRTLKSGGLPGFDLSFAPGTAKSLIVGNNITTSGGGILVRNGVGLGILNNWIEHPGVGSYDIPYVSPNGQIHLIGGDSCAIRDNRTQPLGKDAPYAIVIDGGHWHVIDSNELNLCKAGHIAFINGAKENRLTGFNKFFGGNDVSVGQFAGADTGLTKP